MSLNLKNLISGAQKIRYTIRRKKSQVNIRLIENQDPKPDLIVGPFWSDKAIQQLQIEIKFVLPGTAYYLAIDLIDNRTGWSLFSGQYQNGQPVVFTVVVGGGQNLSLEFRLRNHHNQFPKPGLIYYLNEIRVQSLSTLTQQKSFHHNVRLDHHLLNQLSTDFEFNSIKKTQLEPMLRWCLDQIPERQFFFETDQIVATENNQIFNQNELQQNLQQNQLTWDQNQKQLQKLIEESETVSLRLNQLEKFRDLGTEQQRASFITNQLARIELLFQLKQALIRESYQVSIVLQIHHNQSLNPILADFLRDYRLVLSRDRLKIETLLEELNQALSQAGQSADQALALETEYGQLNRRRTSLIEEYQTAIKAGHSLIDDRRRLLINPVIEIHHALHNSSD